MISQAACVCVCICVIVCVNLQTSVCLHHSHLCMNEHGMPYAFSSTGDESDDKSSMIYECVAAGIVNPEALTELRKTTIKTWEVAEVRVLFSLCLCMCFGYVSVRVCALRV